MAKYRKSALIIDEFEKYLDTVSTQDIVANWLEITDYCFEWLGYLTIERMEQLKNESHFFNSFLDYRVVKKRITLENDDQIDQKLHKIESITTKLPEFAVMRRMLADRIVKLPNDINKAESWLLYYAKNPSLSSDLEASLYFTGKGNKLNISDQIKENLREKMCRIIEKDPFVGTRDKTVLKRAKAKQLLIPEATEILLQYDSHPTLLYFSDYEDDFIDITFIRTIEILGIVGLERWIDVYIRDIERSYAYIDKKHLILYLFQICRSDMTLRSISKVNIEILLQNLAIGEVESEKPWKVSWPQQSSDDYRYVDYYRIACVLVFAWLRIKPVSLNERVLNNALTIILGAQLSNGAWPLTSNSTEGDLLTTCLGIYAIVSAKPRNWHETVKKAENWLLNQINEIGCWDAQGGPQLYINTFCLESILIINEPQKATFTMPEGLLSQHPATTPLSDSCLNAIVFCEGSITGGHLTQFDAKCYSRIFGKEFPNVRFLSIGNCYDVIEDKNHIIKSVKILFPNLVTLKLIDRDNRSDDEVNNLRLKDSFLRVLELRCIENYLLDDEVIQKFCSLNGSTDKFDEVINSKQKAIQKSVERDNPIDDIKSASGDYYDSIRRILRLTKGGSNCFEFMLHSLVPLITEDMKIYKKLKKNIFESI